MARWITRLGRLAALAWPLAVAPWLGCAPEDPATTRPASAPAPTEDVEVAPGLEPDDIPQNPTMLKPSDLPPPEAPEPSPEVPAREPEL